MGTNDIITALREIAAGIESAPAGTRLPPALHGHAYRLREIARAMEAHAPAPISLASDVRLAAWPEHPIQTNGYRVAIDGPVTIPPGSSPFITPEARDTKPVVETATLTGAVAQLVFGPKRYVEEIKGDPIPPDILDELGY